MDDGADVQANGIEKEKQKSLGGEEWVLVRLSEHFLPFSECFLLRLVLQLGASPRAEMLTCFYYSWRLRRKARRTMWRLQPIDYEL